MNRLFYIILIAVFAASGQAAEPELIVKAKDHPWLYPIYTPDGKAIAFTTPDLGEIWKFDLVTDREPSRAARGDSIGRRFLFDPSRQDDRVVYRVRIQAHPDKPVRLISTSIHLFDPLNISSNFGEIIGPYAQNGQVYYRRSLAEPMLSLVGEPLTAGAYMDRDSHSFWVEDSAGSHIYDSPAAESVHGFETSPDGRFAAVVAEHENPILYLVSLTDGARTDLGRGRWPMWSGDSKKLVYLTWEGTHHLISIHEIDGNFKSIEFGEDINPDDPSLNADGSKILFTSNGSIYQVDAP